MGFYMSSLLLGVTVNQGCQTHFSSGITYRSISHPMALTGQIMSHYPINLNGYIFFFVVSSICDGHFSVFSQKQTKLWLQCQHEDILHETFLCKIQSVVQQHYPPWQHHQYILSDLSVSLKISTKMNHFFETIKLCLVQIGDVSRAGFGPWALCLTSSAESPERRPASGRRHSFVLIFNFRPAFTPPTSLFSLSICLPRRH